MQKDKLKLIFILILAFLLFSCTKEIKESAEERNSVVKNEVTEKKPLLILEHTIPSKEEDDEDIDFTEEEPPIVLTDENTPKTELIKLLERKKRHAWSLHKIQLEIDMYDVHGNSYEEFEKSGIDYLNRQKNTEIVKVDSDNKNIYCKQTLNLPSGKELIYDAVYTFYPYPKNFAYTNYELREKPVIADRQVQESKRVHGKITEAEKDINKNKNIKIFERYINKYTKEHRHKTGDKPYKVFDYVKGNFTGSGKDEYIVLFTAPFTKSELEDGIFLLEYSYIKYVECFIMENDKVIKMYKLPGHWGHVVPRDKTKIDLGEQFSFGWIADFNQNGINEIFVHRKEVFGSSFFSIEFIDNRFVEIPITNRGDILKSVDWEQSKIVVETNPFRLLVLDSKDTRPKYFAEYQWCEKEYCYVLLSNKQYK